jgi:hypothetical protein
MTTVSRGLPDRPHLDVPKRQARELLALWRIGDRDALDRIRRRHPKFADADDARVAAGPFRLSDAQYVIAREYGLAHWAELKQRGAADSVARELLAAIRADDRAAAVGLVQANPEALHIPLWSGNWGPPMSHAANLGRLEIIKAMAALGTVRRRVQPRARETALFRWGGRHGPWELCTVPTRPVLLKIK